MKGFKSLLLIVSAALVFCSCEKKPEPEMNFNISSPVINEPVIFKDLSKDGDSRVWDFGDGVMQYDAEITYKFKSIGETTVTLTSYSKSGKKSKSVSQAFNVGDDCSFLLSVFDDRTGETVRNAEVEIYYSPTDSDSKPFQVLVTDQEGKLRVKGLHPNSQYIIKCRKSVEGGYISNINDFLFDSPTVVGAVKEIALILMFVGE